MAPFSDQPAWLISTFHSASPPFAADLFVGKSSEGVAHACRAVKTNLAVKLGDYP